MKVTSSRLWNTFYQHLVPEIDAPKIKFLGVFDSVPGTYWSKLRRKFVQLQFEHETLDAWIEYAFQLLSIDDNRNPSYKPFLWRKTSHTRQSFDQVWMPGVHADLGGNSGSVFLNNVAFLTMIGVAKARCNFKPWDWDEERFNEAINALQSVPPLPVVISSERGKFWNPNRALFFGKRSIGEAKYHSQSLHPIIDVLLGKPISIRGRTAPYLPRNVTEGASALPRFQIPIYHDLILKETKRAVP
ncbi:MAG TPA: DUF2235 domain-containing protein [Roseiarcus sp.]|jgi:hypothetical protein|nr:DUF2235 domain-containing protein [Roseiarcus sp.]